MSKKVYIFGAGGSVHANGPLNKDWIKRIRENKENIKQNKAAIDFLNALQGFDNIEALLSLIDLSIIEQHNYLPISASLDYLKNIREKIIDCIVNVAREINTNDRLVNDFFEKTKLQDGDTVINFNYDLLVDCGLYKTNLWNPYLGIKDTICGYGFGTSHLFLNNKNFFNYSKESKVNYFKLHGSINWSKTKDNGLILDWDQFDPQGILQKINFIFPDPPVDFIITPSFVKIFKEIPLRMMWRRAHETISEALEIYIIGYSFPKADVLARQLLLQVNNSIKKISVIDPLIDGCSESDKREDIISMLPWESNSDFWVKKIEIIRKTLKQYM